MFRMGVKASQTPKRCHLLEAISANALQEAVFIDIVGALSFKKRGC